MGLLDDYGLDQAINDAKAPSFEVDDGEYGFEVGDIFVQKGTKNKPDDSWLVIDYLLYDLDTQEATGKSTREWFGLPKNAASPTTKELETLGYYKQRLISLGVPEEDVNTVDREDLVGRTGTLALLTKKGYQNIRNLTLADDGDNEFQGEEAAPEPAPEPAPAPAATRRPAARPAAGGTKRANPFG